MATAREVALKALIEYRRRGAWPELWLSSALTELSPEDAGLCSALVGGVMQRRMLLDFYLEGLSSVKLKKITPQVLDILRLGLYQILYMDGVPDYAAVNEAAGQARRHANPRAAGFVNGVLREAGRRKDALPQPDTGDALEDLSIRHSYPRWLVEAIYKRLGVDGCRDFLEWGNLPAPVVARVNTLRISADGLIDKLDGAAVRHPWLPDAVVLTAAGEVIRGGALREGLLYIMGAASQLCVLALAPEAGATVLDLCAAPGGKSLMAGQMMGGRGRLVAMDIHPHKADLIAKNAENLGLSDIIQTVAADATVLRPALKESADFVICDVPCSGLGIVGRKPDIRYKNPEDMAALPALQAEILRRAGDYAKPGGVVVYSTCTLLEAENEAVVEGFLRERPEFECEGFTLPHVGEVPSGMVTLWPQIHGTEGFFISKLRKKA